MNDDIREYVKDAYGKVARKRSETDGAACSCCGPDANLGRPAEELGYTPDELAAIPAEAEAGLSCGNPISFAAPRPGETVVDLGAGPGKDCFLAAHRVGASGRVIGIDMTDDMLELANRNNENFRNQSGLDNVEFRKGYIEELPLENESADVIVSNCVINLSPDKEKVFHDAFRVLRPGGRLVTSDIVLTAPLPEALKSDKDLYAGCLSGALLKDDYIAAIRNAGFSGIEILKESRYGGNDGGCCSDSQDINGYASSIIVRTFKCG